jgi:hypothetical protein
MAYLARIEPDGSDVIALPAIVSSGSARFTDLEWSVIRLARIDALWTIRPAGRLRRAWNWFLGRSNSELANPRLEALRRMAVLSWHYGFTVAGEAVADFLSAGFSLSQYELLVSRIARSINAPAPGQSREAFA